jgi:hypothetical protein
VLRLVVVLGLVMALRLVALPGAAGGGDVRGEPERVQIDAVSLRVIWGVAARGCGAAA